MPPCYPRTQRQDAAGVDETMEVIYQKKGKKKTFGLSRCIKAVDTLTPRTLHDQWPETMTARADGGNFCKTKCQQRFAALWGGGGGDVQEAGKLKVEPFFFQSSFSLLPNSLHRRLTAHAHSKQRIPDCPLWRVIGCIERKLNIILTATGVFLFFQHSPQSMFYSPAPLQS